MSPNAARHAVWIWVFVVCVLGVGQSAHVQCSWWQHCAQQAGHPRPLDVIEGSRVAAVGSSAELNGRPQPDGPSVRPRPDASRFSVRTIAAALCRSLMGARRPFDPPCCSGDGTRGTNPAISQWPLCPKCAPPAPDCPHSSPDQTLAFHRGAAREAERRAVAAAAEQQVRNQDVCTSVQNNLPVSIQVPEGQRNKDFNYRIPEQQVELTRLVVAPNRTAPMATTRPRGPSGDPPTYSEATSLSLAAFNHEQPISSVKVRRCANNNKPPSDRQFLT